MYTKATLAMKMLNALEEKEECALCKKLVQESHFSFKQVKNLVEFHRNETKMVDEMEFSEFTGILFKHFGINDKRIYERIFKAFDTDKDTFISRVEWVKGMNILLLGTGEEQRAYCFSVYDLYGEGCITKEGMTTLLQDSLRQTGAEEEGEDGLKEGT